MDRFEVNSANTLFTFSVIKNRYLKTTSNPILSIRVVKISTRLFETLVLL